MGIAPSEILTSRTRVRRLRGDEFPAFARMTSRSHAVFAKEESGAAFQRINASLDERGFGIYAVEVSSAFAGMVGLSTPSFQSWLTPCMEILWRLQTHFWGRGLASEAAGTDFEHGSSVLFTR